MIGVNGRVNYSFLEARVYRVALPVLRLSSFDVFLHEGHFVLRYGASVDPADIGAYLHYRQVVPNADTLDALMDLRALDFARLRRDNLAQGIEVNQRFPNRDVTRRAILVSDTLGYGLMRQYQIMNDVHGVAPQDTILVTRSEPEAVGWIGLTEGKR